MTTPDGPRPDGHEEDAAAPLKEYLPILSHDVRTPMTAIKGASGLLLAGSGGVLSEHQMKLVEICNRNADLVTLLVQDVVDLLRLRSGLAEIHPTEFDASADVQEAWSEMAGQTSLAVAVTHEGTGVPIRTDRYFFRRATSALLRFPQPYPAVTDVTLTVTSANDGAVLALTASPLSRGEAIVDALVRTPPRGQRQMAGRLQVTGMELSLLNALSRWFSTRLAIETPAADALRISLHWPPCDR